jgi:ribosome maturation factor RimP
MGMGMGKFDAMIVDIQRLAQPICDEIGIEIVHVNVNPHNETVHIQVFADKPEGGIGMEACAEFNRRLAAKLDNEMNLGDNYTLEVSSPGLDRALIGYRDLRRVLGREVQVFFKERINGKCEMSGSLQAVREADIILVTKKGEVVVAMDKIEKAKQIIN